MNISTVLLSMIHLLTALAARRLGAAVLGLGKA